MNRPGLYTCALAVLLLTGLLVPAGATGLSETDVGARYRHVPSPDWQDQVIYFVLTDRFADGNAANNDQGADEYDPEDGRKYSGGDLAGVHDRLEYIEELGASAVWITPPVKNQWWDPLVDYGGYHGYWASDFSRLDPHVGTLEEYRQLAEALHRRGMYLVQDVVVNHTGNFFTYDDAQGDPQYDPDDPTEGFRINTGSVPVSAPELFPLQFNDVRTEAGREANVYHWTPDIQDESLDEQRLDYQLFDLDDLNTENPVVRETLRDAFGKWVRDVGVDAFRVDTAIYVSHEFWNSFFHASDTPSPGIFEVARETGREHFLAFGEAFVGSGPMESGGEERIASYLGTEESPEFNSMINFPLHFTMNRVFAEGRPTHHLEYRLDAIAETFEKPELLPIFIDNHDTARFLTRTTLDGLRQALMFMMTVPGIPVIYQGTEQAFTEQRASMFAGGYGSGGEDHFRTDSEHFVYLQELIELRRSEKLFTRGTLEVLASTERGAGVFAYSRRLNDRQALVLMNTADHPVLLRDLVTDLAPGTVLEARASINAGASNGRPVTVVVGPDGRITRALAGRAAMVLLPTERTTDVPGEGVSLSLSPDLAGATFSEDVSIRGSISEPGAELELVVNGELGRDEPVTASGDGSFSTTLPISGFPVGRSTNTVSVYAPEHQIASQPVTFTTVVTAEGRSTTVYDQIGDDVGPRAGYTLPTADGYGDQLDITRTTVALAGDALEVTVHPAEITSGADPPNGFDHALFHVFLDVPAAGDSGLSVLPGLDAEAPEGVAWDYAGVHSGWTNALYSAEGASSASFGEARAVSPGISIDADAGTITFRYPTDVLGPPDELIGTRVYVTTWGWDRERGAAAPLREEAGPRSFGGRQSADDPRILDDTAVIVLEDRRQIMAPDPSGDDNGPTGEYELPTDSSFGDQMDIERLSVIPVGSNLRVELEMGEITQVWGPPNGFDHVLFHVYIDLPGEDGVSVLPRINATAPEGFAWDFMGFHEGWNNRLYSSEGADAETYGTVVTPTPEISVNVDAATVQFTYSAQALGNPENLDDVAVYVTTWDWDGPQADYRGLVAAPTQWNFGGGDEGSDPLIMDSVLAGISTTFTPPEPEVQDVLVRFVVEGVPDSTPDDATLYLAGPFNNWTPDHEAFAFSRENGTYVLEWEFKAGTGLAYRITRGSWNNAEVIDPDDRFANRSSTVPDQEEHRIEIEIDDWWD